MGPLTFHARDWYVVPNEVVVIEGRQYPRSRRTNICEIPDYKFAGGTIDRDGYNQIRCPKCLVMLDGYNQIRCPKCLVMLDGYNQIRCPKCLVMLDGYFAETLLVMLPFIRPIGQADSRPRTPEIEEPHLTPGTTRLLHGRETT